MQTNFSLAQLADPHVAESEKILRKCVHCGFCTATCPTYVTLGNELDSPRGRIYLIKDMLENGRPADKEIVTHIDRCLSCLACMTTCPSGVNYMHLVDHARAHIQETYDRPLLDRLTRAMLAFVLPYPRRFRAALRLAKLGKPFIGLFEKLPALNPLAAMLKLANALARATTGARPELASLLVDALNAGRLPEIRTLGSIGQSDLAQMADRADGVLGDDFELARGEAIALLNQSAFATGYAALAFADALVLLDVFDHAGALDLEALDLAPPGLPRLHR